MSSSQSTWEVVGDGAKISTGDGSIHIGLSQPVAMALSTGDGDIEITSATALAVDVELRGEDVHIGPKISLLGTVRDGYAQGQVNGGGPLIKANTGDGTIRLRLGQH